MPGGNWHHLINGTWSPLYPFFLGLFRRAFGISPSNEMFAAHLLNIVFFAASFLCFEYFLMSLLRRSGMLDAVQSRGITAFSPWAFACVAYALFLWSSIFAITLEFLRPDMLMSCFLYLAAAMLLNMADTAPRWRSYLALGVVLGVGYLAKAPMLPISVVILAISLFLVKDWRRAVKMAVAAFAAVVLIGALYFVPLSLSRGKFILGESGPYNYLTHVDRAGSGEGWYLDSPGHGSGRPVHPPLKIFSTPPAYAFGYTSQVTHPLRFEPSWWMQGMRERVALKRQIGETMASVVDLGRSLIKLIVLIAALIWLGLSVPRQQMQGRFLRVWPLLLIGVAGCAMYVTVHVEARYVGSFLTLFFCGALACFPEIPRKFSGMAFRSAAIVIALTLLVPGFMKLWPDYQKYGRGANEDALAAGALHQSGIQSGDAVGRISKLVTDLTVERVARLEVVDEVDFTHASAFWSASPETQHQLLQALAAHGAKAVIATEPRFNGSNQAEWSQLASTKYWIWRPGSGGTQIR